MSVIKTILSLVNGKYKSDLNDSVAATKRAADGIKSVWSAAGSVFGFGIGLGTLLGLAKNTAGKLEDLKHASENLGMPTDEMQRWNSAARKSGLEAEAMTMGISRMSGVINDALGGDKTANIKLGMIGLSPEQLAGLGVSEQFGMILDGINNVKDGTEKLALSNDLLGRSGKRIGALAANWREYKQAMDGKLIPESEIKDAEHFEQAMRQLEGLLTRLVSKSWLIPVSTKIVKTFTDMYNQQPTQQDYKDTEDAGIISGASKIQKPVGYLEMADAALRKEDNSKFVNKKYSQSPGFTWEDLIPGRPSAPDIELPIPQKDKEAWLDKNKPDWRKKEQDARAEEESNKKVKSEAEAKAKEEAEAKALDNRTKAMLTPDIEAQSKKVQDGIDKERQAQQSLDKALDDQLSTMQDQLIIQQLKLKGKEREAAITAEMQKAEKAAQAAGRSLDPAQRAFIEQSAGALYDAENANKPRTFAPPQPEAPIITDAALRVGAFVGPQAQQSDNVQSIWKATKDLVQETRDNVRIIKDRMPQRLDAASNDGPRFQES